MSVYLFTALCYLLLFILMCNTLCEQTLVGAQALLDAKDPFELFHKNPIDDAKKPNGDPGEKADVNVKNYNSPVLVSTKEFVFALAGVERGDGAGGPAKQNVDIITKYTKNGKLLAKKDVLTAASWTSQFAVQLETDEDNIFFVKGLLAVATEEKVYLLNSLKKTDSVRSADPKWEFKFAVATIKNEGEGSTQKIVWNEHTIDAANVIKELKETFTEEQDSSFSFGGSAFLMEEKKMVFSLVVDDSKKRFLL